MEKYCNHCKQTKDVSEFNKNKRRKDGLQDCCKICSREKNRNSYKRAKLGLIEHFEDNSPVGYKKCRECETVKPVSEFGNNKTNKDGLTKNCLDCQNRLKREYCDKNRESVRFWNRKHQPLKEKEVFPEGYKRCSKCKVLKSVLEFSSHAGHKDGLCSWCKDCVIKEAEPKRDEKNKRYREIYKENAEEERERLKKYREDNREWYVNWSRLWRKNNKTKTKIYKHRRRVLETSAQGCYTEEDIEKKRKEQNGFCWWCGNPFDETQNRLMETIDHVIPLARGGTNEPSNIVLAHKSCNSSKGTKMPWEWKGYSQ